MARLILTRKEATRVVVYRNTATGRTVNLLEPSPLMDRSQRWERADDDQADDQADERPAPDGKPYDPAAHSVPQVRAYLARADDAERTRVLDAERAGKARRGVLGDDQPPTEPTEDAGD
jgi:hypothetical protein